MEQHPFYCDLAQYYIFLFKSIFKFGIFASIFQWRRLQPVCGGCAVQPVSIGVCVYVRVCVCVLQNATDGSAINFLQTAPSFVKYKQEATFINGMTSRLATG